MSPAIRRAAPPAPAAGGSVNFGDDNFYVGGSNALPAGSYALEFTTIIHQSTKKDGSTAGEPFLAVLLTAYPLEGGEAHEQPLGMGRKSHLSFVPSADGKGLEPIPGGPAATATNLSNWSIFLKSMKDCGLPQGTFVGDLSVLDGVHVRTDLIDEPAERQQIRSQTGEAADAAAADQSKYGPRKVPVVVEILEDGKPWEGTGGFEGLGQPAPAPTPAKAPGRKAPGKPAPPQPAAPRRIAPPRQAAPPPQAEEGEMDEAELQQVALQGCTDFLLKPANANGTTKLALRTGCFSAVQKLHGDDVANAVLSSYFGNDTTLNSILGELGYVVAGQLVKVA